jgi:hypothetical protein
MAIIEEIIPNAPEDGTLDDAEKKWLFENFSLLQEQMNRDFFFEVARGNFPGHFAENIVAHDSSVALTISTVGNNLGQLQTYSATAAIDSISSDNAGDTHDITIQGLDINYNPVGPQVVTLNGQNRVAIPIPIFRVQWIRNLTATQTLGALWVYENTALAAGKPIDLTKIRGSISKISGGAGPSHERSTDSVHTIPAGKIGVIVFGKTTVTDNKAIEMSFWGRQPGGVFTLAHTLDLLNNDYDYFFKLPLVIPEKTDMELRATVGAGAPANVAANYDVILIDDGF